jgi:hypothetical protein
MVCQTACKPGSVPARRRAMNGHSSGTRVAARLARPTRAAKRECFQARLAPDHAAPIRSCSRWGLPCRPCCQGRGALLPHRFTLTLGPESRQAVCFLWHFPWGRPRRPLAGTVFPWSPDFPPPRANARQRPSSRLADPFWSRCRIGARVGGWGLLRRRQGRVLLFLKKKKQKDFYFLGAASSRVSGFRAAAAANAMKIVGNGGAHRVMNVIT